MSVDLTKCVTTNADALSTLVSRCAALTQLNVTACPLLTPADVATLAQAAYATLKIVRLYASETDPASPCILPDFVAPHPSAQFKARTFFGTTKAPKADKKKKGDKKKK